ncbi:MAG: response regulator transcription factor [Pseudomonadales bacterium]|nr:response regulator transcription factor [Pseudomonadales bacterium]
MKPRLLFVEDHQPLLENLSEYFADNRFICDFAPDGLTALNLLSLHPYDLVVLDLMLPGIDGITLCKRIRELVSSSMPVLMLTALDSIDNKIDGFQAGADDYLCKPFDFRELDLRIQALLKRGSEETCLLSAGNIHFHPGSLTLSTDNGRTLCLSGLNASLFETLIRAYPSYVTYQAISQALWGTDNMEEKTIRTHIYTLRKALKDAVGHSLIRGIYGRGYQLDPEFG